MALVNAWTELLDLVTANQGEAVILQLCELLVAAASVSKRVYSPFTTHIASSPLAWRALRAGDGRTTRPDPVAAVAHAEAIENLVTSARITLEQVHHGDGIASWAVNRRAVPRWHGMRTGLEDTPVLPDGRQAHDNVDLVAAAAQILGIDSTID